jgi:hypothetical protein
MKLAKPGPGRPRKYGRPSRAVTVTLPEDVIARLQTIDADLGRAVVAATERRTPQRASARSAEVASYGNHAVILVMPIRSLQQLPGVQLVPVGNGRALIALDLPGSVADLELSVRDTLDRRTTRDSERQTLEALAAILRDARQSRGVKIQERTIIVLEARRRNGAASRARERRR